MYHKTYCGSIKYSHFSIALLALAAILVAILGDGIYKMVPDSETIMESSVQFMDRFENWEVNEILVNGDMALTSFSYWLLGEDWYPFVNAILLSIFVVLTAKSPNTGGLRVWLLIFAACLVPIYNKEALILAFGGYFLYVSNCSLKKRKCLLALAGYLLVAELSRRGLGMLVVTFLIVRFVGLSPLVLGVTIALSLAVYDPFINLESFQRLYINAEIEGTLGASYPHRVAANFLYLIVAIFKNEISYASVSQFLYGIFVFVIIFKGVVSSRRSINRCYMMNLVVMVLLLSVIPFAHPRYLIALTPLLLIDFRKNSRPTNRLCIV